MTPTGNSDGPASPPLAHRARRAPRQEFAEIRGLRYGLRRWGDPGARPLLMLHGARDCAATFQFLVDALEGEWNIVAPDWRGHGHSQWTPQAYWVHDFLADLDALLDAVFPGVRPDVVGHSMGGNVAGLYIGLRPDRIRRFVSLDAMGPMPHRLPVDMAATLDSWLRRASAVRPRGHDSLDEVAGRLMKANPRLTGARAMFLAEHCTAPGDDGKRRWLFDPSLKHSLPSLHTVEEWAAIWARVRIPVRWIGASDIRRDAPSFSPETVAERRRLLPHAVYTRLEDTGHNIHHDRPEDVAALIEDFLGKDEA